MAEAQQADPKTSQKTVSVRTNGDVNSVGYIEGMTVREAVVRSGINTGWTTKYFVNGLKVRSYHALQAGDRVTLSPRIKNGS